MTTASSVTKTAMRIGMGLVGAAGVGAAAYLGWRQLHQPQKQLPPTPPQSPPPGAGRSDAPELDGRYAPLSRTIPSPVTSASDAAGFHGLMDGSGPGWAASDGVYSVDLEDGRVLWIYGDTMMNTMDGAGNLHRNAAFIRNSAILQNGTTATTLATGTTERPSDFLKPRETDQWYWPAHGTIEGDDLTLFMGQVRKTGDVGWAFGWAGSDMIVLDRDTLAVKETRDLPVPAGRQITWGTYVLEDGPYTYMYGMEGGESAFDRWAVVARTSRDHAKDGNWEYWDGTSWVSDVEKTARITDGVSNQYSVIRTKTGYALVSQELFFGTGLAVRTSPSPVGPWSDWKHIDDGPPLATGQISYNAMAHPQFEPQSEKLMVGWSMNLQSAELPKPDQNHLYQPQFRSIDRSLLEAPTSNTNSRPDRDS